MFNFWKRKQVTLKEPVREPDDGMLRCPNCGSSEWQRGPEGGMSVNVKCAGCGLWFNNTPFGLDFIGIKGTVGEEKKIVWWCPQCGFIDEETAGYGKYPNCPTCQLPLKVCWSREDFPREYCETCDVRFKCLTTRGNFS